MILQLNAVPPLGPTLDLIELFRRGPLFTPNYPEPDDPLRHLKILFLNSGIYPLLYSKDFSKFWSELNRLSEELPSPQKNLYPLSTRDSATAYAIARFWKGGGHLLPRSFPPPPPQKVFSELPDFELLDDSSPEIQFLSEKSGYIEEIFLNIETNSYLNVLKNLKNIVENFSELSNPYSRALWERWAALSELFPPAEIPEKLYLRSGPHRVELNSNWEGLSLGGYRGLKRRGRWEHLSPSSLLFLSESRELFLSQFLSGNILFFEPESRSSFTDSKRVFVGVSLPLELFIQPPPGSDSSTASHVVAFIADFLKELGGIFSKSIADIKVAFPSFEVWREIYPCLGLFLRQIPRVGARIELITLEPAEIEELYSGERQHLVKLLIFSRATIGETETLPAVSVKFETEIRSAGDEPHSITLSRTREGFRKVSPLTADAPFYRGDRRDPGPLIEFFSKIKQELIKQLCEEFGKPGAKRYV